MRTGLLAAATFGLGIGAAWYAGQATGHVVEPEAPAVRIAETPAQRAERALVARVAMAISNLHHCRAALRKDVCLKPDSEGCQALTFYSEGEDVLFARLGRLQTNRVDQLTRVSAMLAACQAGSLSDMLGGK